MAELNLSQATTTNFTGTVPDFIVKAKALDAATPNLDETYWYFDYAPQYFGYYLQFGEVFSAANAMATWAFGAGYSCEDPEMQAQLDHVTGMGRDTFLNLIWSAEVVKLVVGDSFLEVKRSDEGTIINMIPYSPERVRIVFGKEGLLKRYDVWNGKDWKPIKKENMLHFINKRIGDQLHGTSQISPGKDTIKYMHEALEDERIIKHRDKALGIVYYETDKAGKITYANAQIEKAVANGEMVGLPKDTAKIEGWPSKSSEDRSAWITLLQNKVYQDFGVPRSIASSDGTSEVGGKMGNVNFESTYAKERNDMEADLWLQQAIKVKFEKQASLGGLVKTDLQKNSNQTNIQPNDVTANMNRE